MTRFIPRQKSKLDLVADNDTCLTIPIGIATTEADIQPSDTQIIDRFAAEPDQPLISSNRRILIIDDTPAIHDDFRKILVCDEPAALEAAEAALFGTGTVTHTHPGFELHSAFQGQEALGMVKRAMAESRPYALAFVDIRMPPGWDGVETISQLWAVDPELQVVICTAYSDYSWDDIVQRFGNTDRLVALKKPFDNIEVLQLAHALTRKWQLAQEAEGRLIRLNFKLAQRSREVTAANKRLVQEIAERKAAEEMLRRTEEQLRQSQKLEAIGQLAGGVAHDFNNLLAVIRGNTELALMAPDGLSAEARDCLGQVTTAADRAANLTRQLLAFSRKQIMQSHPVDLNEVVGNLTKMLKRIIGEHIQLQCDYAPDLRPVQADGGLLEQVLINLVVNARDAMHHGGLLLITTAARILKPTEVEHHPDTRPGEFVTLRVRDNGVGIAPTDLPHIFEPFFTTKEVGKGTGLGLATVYGIIKQHQGWVEVDSEPGAGSTFTIVLPAADLATAENPGQGEQSDAPGGGELVLLVEDDEAVRTLMRRILAGHGYRVLEASSGPEALAVTPENLRETRLLLTDLIMPQGITGRALAEQLRNRNPALKVIFMSGYSGEALNQNDNFVHSTKTRFLAKPCAPCDLLRIIREVLDEK